MIDRLRSWLPLLPLLLLLGASYWLNLQVQPPEAVSNPNLRHDPDYVIDNFTATTLDEQGKIRFVMSAKKMWHYPDDDTTLLDSPKLSSLAAERPPMHMSALNGEISRKGDEVFLRNDVIIVRPAFANRSEMTFNTDYLHVLPNKDTVDTDRAITLTDAKTRVNAIGMELDNKKHVIQFLSNVRTVYEPAKK